MTSVDLVPAHGFEPMTAAAGRRAGARRLLVLAVLLAVLVGACSSNDSASPGLTPPTTRDPKLPASQGETCADPAGDLSADANSTAAGTLTEPAGIDLVDSRTAVEGDRLVVDLTTAGPIDAATNPEFFIDSGDPQQSPALSWELRLAPRGGRWTATLVRFPTAIGERDVRTVLTTPVSVRDNRLRAEIPLADLPPIATTLWLFGASAGASDVSRIFDECLPFQQTQGSTPGTPPSSTRPTTTVPAGRIGETLTAPDGSRVTVKTVVVPARPNRVVEEEPVPGSRLAAAEVQVCAGGTEVADVGERRVTFRSTDGFGSPPWAAPAHTNDPRFPAGQTLRPNECVEGWITFQVGAAAEVGQILYDTTGTGAGPFLTFSP